MKYFPITILDDFYENPDDILELAKEVDYQREGENTYPGCVSNLTVDKINYNLFFYTMKKIISLYWEGECNENFEVTMQFQKIEPHGCLLYTSPSPRDRYGSRMPSSA